MTIRLISLFRWALVGFLAIYFTGCAHTPPPKKDPVATLEKPAQILSTTLVQRMGNVHKKMRVAVLPFTDSTGQSLDLGFYMADKVISALGTDQRIELVERSRLDQVVKELKLSSLGLVNEESMKSLGNMLGADAVILGTFTDLGDAADLICRIVEPETGRILGTANITIPRDKVVQHLWRNSTQKSNLSSTESQLVVTQTRREPKSTFLPWFTGITSVSTALFGTVLGISVIDDMKRSPFEGDYLRELEGIRTRSGVASAAFTIAGITGFTTLLLLLTNDYSDESPPHVSLTPIMDRNGVVVTYSGPLNW